MTKKINSNLTAEQKLVLFEDGTEAPGTSELNHEKGTLSMVRTQNDPNSAGSQFFISLSKNENLDSIYTIFGYLVDGEHILSRISIKIIFLLLFIDSFRAVIDLSLPTKRGITIPGNTTISLNGNRGSVCLIFIA